MLFNVTTLIVVLTKDLIQQVSMKAFLALHLLQGLKGHQLNFVQVNKESSRITKKIGDGAKKKKKSKVYLDLDVYQACVSVSPEKT